ncbi:MAG: NAD(P)H-hydrate dehydratase [Thermodesulfobacteriota bacterium]|nr:NAD(P)H-hydrate dehydratase [Thermodesulfobacteriota bacterium]
MLKIVGTVPDDGFPLISGEAGLKNGFVTVGDRRISVNRGTPALLAAAVIVAKTLSRSAPFAHLVGDTGLGKGSRRLYSHLAENLSRFDFKTIIFHYLQPDVDWHNQVLFAVEEISPRPVLIADAGFMYAAKMSGRAGCYDLFTPDIGELAFLADPDAPHPFYARGFILHREEKVLDMIQSAYKHKNAAEHLLVKGEKDYVADPDGVRETVDGPVEEAMEAMGGTGDTLSGIVSVLIDSGMNIRQACAVAARTNRLAGRYARPTPATQVAEVIRYIPKALDEVLR